MRYQLTREFSVGRGLTLNTYQSFHQIFFLTFLSQSDACIGIICIDWYNTVKSGSFRFSAMMGFTGTGSSFIQHRYYMYDLLLYNVCLHDAPGLSIRFYGEKKPTMEQQQYT